MSLAHAVTYVDPFNNDVIFSKALKSAVFLFFTFYFWKEFYQIANIEPGPTAYWQKRGGQLRNE